MAKDKKAEDAPRLAGRGGSGGARAAGSGVAGQAGNAKRAGADEGDQVAREAARQSRPSRASAASGRMTGALRSADSVRGRHEKDEPMEAGPTTSARGGAPARLGSGERRPNDEPEHTPSPTAIAAEAMRSGVVAGAVSPSPEENEIPGEGGKILAGDPDDLPLRNEYVGEETPGGSTPTPDQGNVDDIGRAYGVQEEDSGELRTSTEILEARDSRRRAGMRRKKD